MSSALHRFPPLTPLLLSLRRIMPTLDPSHPSLELSFLPAPLTILQLAPSAPIPTALITLLTGDSKSTPPPFLSFTRTPHETSIILDAILASDLYPSPASPEHPAPLATSGPWSALVVKGPMDLSLTGIMHALTGPLGEAEVPVFASSTWDTDYVLVNREHEGKAKEALEKAGWKFAA